MRSLLAPRLDDLPVPEDHTLPQWVAFWSSFPGAWSALLRRFEATIHEQPERFLALALDAHQLSGDGETEDVDGWLCNLCGRWFTSIAGRNMHRQRVHEQRTEVRFFVMDGECPVCHRWYHSRVRAIYHVRHSPCLVTVANGGVDRLCDGLVATLDAADLELRREARRHGRHHRGGPAFLHARPLAPVVAPAALAAVPAALVE